MLYLHYIVSSVAAKMWSEVLMASIDLLKSLNLMGSWIGFFFLIKQLILCFQQVYFQVAMCPGVPYFIVVLCVLPDKFTSRVGLL